jgi:ribosomal protein uS17
MAKKKNEETVEETEATEPAETEATEETVVESKADDNSEGEDKPKKASKKSAKKADDEEETSIVEDIIDAAASVVENVVETVAEGASALVNAVIGDSKEVKKKESKRAERVGIVASDKMTKTVTVRVDRQVKHPIYRKYIKRRKKFMAHDELGSTVGDRVRIVETRPLSARKRWRVVEIIQKAEK